MKILKLAVVCLLLSVVSFSCSSNDDPEGPTVCPPEFIQYDFAVDFSLSSKYSVTDKPTGHVIVDVNHTIASTQTFVYAIHRQVDGTVVSANVIIKERINNEVKNNVLPVTAKLLPGKYYVSAVAMMNDDASAGSYAYMDELKKNYKEAVVQTYNTYTYYKTMEIEVLPDSQSAKNKATMDLEKITADLVFEIVGLKPTLPKDKYFFVATANDIPSAFFLSTGKTLTSKEMEDRNLKKYKATRSFKLPHSTDATKQLVTQFHSLINDNLPDTPAERGTIGYKVEELSGDEYITLEETTNPIDEIKPATSFHLYIHKLESLDKIKE